MGNQSTEATKTCKHCKSQIPKGAKVCPVCKKKQGGIGKWIIIAIIVIGVIGAAAGGSESDPKTASNSSSGGENERKPDSEKKEETEAPIEYISVTANDLANALSSNAMKAQNDYKDKYLEITGKLGNIDSNGKYIGINSDIDFDLTNIQCYLKTDEHKEVIMQKSTGDEIKVKGYCKDVGEIMGYSIDIETVE